MHQARWPAQVGPFAVPSTYGSTIAAASPSRLFAVLRDGRVVQATTAPEQTQEEDEEKQQHEPGPLQWHPNAFFPASKHGNIEAIVARQVAGQLVVATGDDRGTLRAVTRVQGQPEPEEQGGVAEVVPAKEHVRDAGFTGVDVHPIDPGKLLSVRHMQRTLALYDYTAAGASGASATSASAAAPIASTALIFGPTSATFVARKTQQFGAGLVAVTEGPNLVVWDERSGAIVQRTKVYPLGFSYQPIANTRSCKTTRCMPSHRPRATLPSAEQSEQSPCMILASGTCPWSRG